MPKFGFSVIALLALAVPAWASDLPPAVAVGYPAPVGYPAYANEPVPLGGYPAQAGYPMPGGYPAPIGYPMPGGYPAPGGYPGYPNYPPPLGAPGPMGFPPGYGPPAGMMPPPGWNPNGPGVPTGNFAFDPSGPGGSPAHSPRVRHEYWVRGDWLYWNLRDMPIPSLITTGDPNRADPAVPGRGNVASLGAGARDLGPLSGARAAFGMWFDEDGELGVEFSGFLFDRGGSATFFSDTTGTAVVSAPVFDGTGGTTVYDFAFPGQFTGSLGLRTATRFFGAEANVLHRGHGEGCEECGGAWLSVDGLFGYRHLQLRERLDQLGRSQATGGVATFNGAILPPGAVVFTTDTFRARSEFHGGQIGARAVAKHDRFVVTAFGKAGAGANMQTLRVDGSTTATGAGATQTVFGGVRALPSNFGTYRNTDFSMIGEAGFEVGFYLTKWASVRVGYNALYWSDVLRPTSVIDPTVNFGQVPIDPSFGTTGGARRPQVVFRSSDFLAHGLVVGLQLDY